MESQEAKKNETRKERQWHSEWEGMDSFDISSPAPTYIMEDFQKEFRKMETQNCLITPGKQQHRLVVKKRKEKKMLFESPIHNNNNSKL